MAWIGRITTSGVITDAFTVDQPANPLGIVLGPDGNLWFNDCCYGKIGRVTPAGLVTSPHTTAPAPHGNAQVADIAAGPDGTLWYTDTTYRTIRHFTP